MGGNREGKEGGGTPEGVVESQGLIIRSSNNRFGHYQANSCKHKNRKVSSTNCYFVCGVLLPRVMGNRTTADAPKTATPASRLPMLKAFFSYNHSTGFNPSGC